MEHELIFIGLACLFGLFMAWGIGANDVANAMGTSVGSGAITIRQAIVIAAVFEFAGAFLAGGEVTATIRSGIVDSALFVDMPEVLIYGMLASLLAAGIWLLFASYFGWPVSTTHSIVGAIVGFGAVGVGMDAVHWSKIGEIVMSWVVSPLIAGVIAYLLFMSVQRIILDTPNPLESARRYVPVYIFIVGFIVALVTMFKGLSHIGLTLSNAESYGIAVAIGLAVMVWGIVVIRRIKIDVNADREFHFANVERVFAVLMMVTACTMAFAHGSNDVANAVGPVAAIFSIVDSGGVVGQQAPTPPWILLLGGAGIVLGLAMYGRRVIETIGSGITELTPSRGFAATLAAAITVVFASATGLPISTTHTLVGAILGVGMARGIAALNLRIVRMIFLSWIVTLPAGALLSIAFFFLFAEIFGG
ncbi:MAG: inorganic phosphate transporter PiT family [Gammaproteobacteria bacterium]|nr:MAG: inorganic phosphate transporter PiT family [Gammaproteobacteria bacterium]TND04070.1 MAG: inorganic phosphate transporter, PiT family [Gammaproteobacteria bacterium]